MNHICCIARCFVLLGSLLWLGNAGLVAAEDGKTNGLGLGDPGTLQSLTIDTGRGDQSGFTLHGSSQMQQLVVTGKYSSGQLRDLTRDVSYEVQPAKVIEVDSSGVVRPTGNGKATITAKSESNVSQSIEVTVVSWEKDLPVNFPNQVVPILTKYGCNSGGCHGKSSGQNGFRLSLLGFEPAEDYEHIVKEARGRRVFPAAPQRSLLLLKASGKLPHGGGSRIEVGSPAYELMRRWIAQGMPVGDSETAKVERIEVIPQWQMMPPQGQQQLTVIAHYTDGSTEDVTRMARYEANVKEMAEVTPNGLVQTTDSNGDVGVMVRYQTEVAVFRATVPLGVEVTSMPAEKGFIDKLVFQKLKELGLPPSEVCDDSTFIRRVTVDIAGRLPTLEETKEFLADNDSAKREEWVDKLLASRDYADFFANKWRAILRNKRRREEDRHGTYVFHDWIQAALQENMPYDKFVRNIIAASGDARQHPPVIWYREVRSVEQQVEDSAQLFLGMRIQCARCHHHPFEKWSRQDYYGFAAFFSRIGRKPGPIQNETRIFHRRGIATSRNPKNNQTLKPTGLGGEPLEIAADEDPRHALVDWMTAPENPFFAKTLVNRYWKHFFNRGLVDPEDDMRMTNPASNPALLDALADHFIKSGFDMKELVRTICRSNVYQLSSLPNEYNADDKQNFSRYYPRRMAAEVLLDSVDHVTRATTTFGGVPRGTKAVQLPDTNFNSYFLTVFGRPESSSACECERTGDANLAQGLHLINSAEIHGKISNGGGLASKFVNDKRKTEKKIEELYLVALSRKPTAEEIKTVKAYLDSSEKKKDRSAKQAYEDIVWSLLNTKEFLFNH